jgi:hypothetical protein
VRVRQEEVVTPVFVFSDDVTSFGSVGDMVRYIEPVDVAEVTGAFDAHGRRLALRAEGLETEAVRLHLRGLRRLR